jgi:uncharacterized heparinase superfamily protein
MPLKKRSKVVKLATKSSSLNIKKILYKSSLYNFWLNFSKPENIFQNVKDPWEGEGQLADAIFQGRYNFAGEEIHAPNKPLWEPNGVGPWWLSEMHGFSWLRHFKARDGKTSRQYARALISDWIRDGNDKYNPVSWKIDILGRRISAWISYSEMLKDGADRKFLEKFYQLLTSQSIHLSRVIHKNKDNPEVFTALRGLIISGICLSGGNKRYILAKNILLMALRHQILNDGCHISKQASITLDILTDLIWIRNALLENDSLVEILDTNITKISHTIRSLRLGDGTLLRSNGGKSYSRDAIDKVLDKTGIKLKSKISASLKSSGYERLASGRTIIIMDCSQKEKNCYNGSLSFEMSVGRDRMIVNCGSNPFNEKSWEKALSSSAAHSTLVINNTNSSSTENNKVLKINVIRELTSGFEIISSSHNGYETIYSAIHKRILKLDARGNLLKGIDNIISGPKINFKIHFHLHPKVNVRLTRNKERILLLLPSGGWEFFILKNNTILSLDVEESIYVEDNGQIKKTNQFIISGETNNSGTQIEWCLSKTTL